MNYEKQTIKSFTDLRVWQNGHKLVIDVYKVTKKFPKDEQFGLTNQVRRAIVSFTSNIAEGFSRNSFKEKIQFYCIALGSLTEVQNQIIIAKDLGYITVEEFNLLEQQILDLNKMMNGLIKKSKTLTRDS